MAELTYKKLTAEDVPAYLDLLKKMAKFEELEDIFVCTEEMLQKCIVEEEKQEVYLIQEDGTNVGFTCFYESFSSFLCKPGLYLDDLFILPEHRGKGYGKMTLDWLAHIAVTRGYGRFEWTCRDWNRHAMDFYEKYGATRMAGWSMFRVTGEKLQEIGIR